MKKNSQKHVISTLYFSKRLKIGNLLLFRIQIGHLSFGVVIIQCFNTTVNFSLFEMFLKKVRKNIFLFFAGAFVVSRKQNLDNLTEEIDQELRSAAEKFGIDYDAMCISDNTSCEP